MSATQKPFAVYAKMKNTRFSLYAFPPPMHHHIRSTNAIESFFRTVRRRTDQIDTFTTATSCLSIV